MSDEPKSIPRQVAHLERDMERMQMQVARYENRVSYLEARLNLMQRHMDRSDVRLGGIEDRLDAPLRAALDARIKELEAEPEPKGPTA